MQTGASPVSEGSVTPPPPPKIQWPPVHGSHFYLDPGGGHCIPEGVIVSYKIH